MSREGNGGRTEPHTLAEEAFEPGDLAAPHLEGNPVVAGCHFQNRSERFI